MYKLFYLVSYHSVSVELQNTNGFELQNTGTH